MKSTGLKSRYMATFLFSLVLLMRLAGAARAQSRDRPPTDPSVELKNQNDRQMEVRVLELSRDPKDPNAIPKASEARINQVKDDFAQLQEINARVMQEYKSGAAPDYKKLSEEMKEINRRARRLNSNLMLPKSEDAHKTKGVEDSPLPALNETITRFVTNPIFSAANTFDTKLASGAKSDLLKIIDLSNRISKGADKLGKRTNSAQKD